MCLKVACKKSTKLYITCRLYFREGRFTNDNKHAFLVAWDPIKIRSSMYNMIFFLIFT